MLGPLQCVAWDDQELSEHRRIFQAVCELWTEWRIDFKLHLPDTDTWHNARDRETLAKPIGNTDKKEPDIVVHLFSREDVESYLNSDDTVVHLATLDELYKDCDIARYGSTKLMPLIKRRNPDATVFILTQHSITDADALRGLTTGGIALWINKHHLQDNRSSSLRLVAMLVGHLRQHLALKGELQSEVEIADSSLSLMPHLKGIFGISDIKADLAMKVEPFFQFSEVSYDSIPEDERIPFLTGILLKGKPGTGKSELCKRIAKALNTEDASLPRNLGPSENPMGWKKMLEETLDNIFRKYARNRVLVIRADDLTFPQLPSGRSTDVGADWGAYLNTFRHLLEDTNAINQGKSAASGPLRKYQSGNRGQSRTFPFRGRILWLFCRNPETQMFEPIESFLAGAIFHVEWTGDPSETERLLKHYANAEKCVFEKPAIQKAIVATGRCVPRALVGQDGKGGMLRELVALAKTAKNKNAAGQYGISEAMVDAWLKTPSSRALLAEICPPSNATFTLDSIGSVPNHSLPQKSGLPGIVFVGPSSTSPFKISVEEARNARDYLFERISKRTSPTHTAGELDKEGRPTGFAAAVLLWFYATSWPRDGQDLERRKRDEYLRVFAPGDQNSDRPHANLRRAAVRILGASQHDQQRFAAWVHDLATKFLQWCQQNNLTLPANLPTPTNPA